MKTKVFKLMAALMVVILSVVLSSCQRDQEITTKSAAETDLVLTMMVTQSVRLRILLTISVWLFAWIWNSFALPFRRMSLEKLRM